MSSGYYINERNYHLEANNDASAAISDVYLEEATGGYYLYCYVDSVKTYINLTLYDTELESFTSTYGPTPDTVYVWDTKLRTLIATVNGAGYVFSVAASTLSWVVNVVYRNHNNGSDNFYYSSLFIPVSGDQGEAIISPLASDPEAGVAYKLGSELPEYTYYFKLTATHKSVPVEDYCAKFPLSTKIDSHQFEMASLTQYGYNTPGGTQLLLQRPGKTDIGSPPSASAATGFLGGIWANEPANFQNFFKAYYKYNTPIYHPLANHFVKRGTAPLPIDVGAAAAIYSSKPYVTSSTYDNTIYLFWDTLNGKTGVYSQRRNLSTGEEEIKFITASSHVIIAVTGGGGGGSTGSSYTTASGGSIVMGYHSPSDPAEYSSVRLVTGGCGGGSGACAHVLVNMRQLAETYRMVSSYRNRPCVQISLGEGGAGGATRDGDPATLPSGKAGESGESSNLYICNDIYNPPMFRLEIQGGLGGRGATINVVDTGFESDYKLIIDAEDSDRSSPTVKGTLYKSNINDDYRKLGPIIQVIAIHDGVYGNVYGNTEGTEGYYDSATGTPPDAWVCWEGILDWVDPKSGGKGTASFGEGFSSSDSIILDQRLVNGWNTSQIGWVDSGSTPSGIINSTKVLTFWEPSSSPFAKIKNSAGDGGKADKIASEYTAGNNIAYEAGFAIGGGGCGSIMAPGGDGGGMRSPSLNNGYYPTGTNGQWGSGGGGGSSSLYAFVLKDHHTLTYELSGGSKPSLQAGGNGGDGRCVIYYED